MPRVAEHQVLSASRSTPSQTTLVASNNGDAHTYGLALSHDGKQIAFALGSRELWISQSDGSDQRRLVSAKDGLVERNVSGNMFLSF